MPLAFLADFPVLAEHTTQAAPGEKYRARTMGSAQRVFFAVMGAVTVYHRRRTRAADGAFGRFEAVDMAIAGTQIAVGHMLVGLLGPCRQLVIKH